MVDRLDGVENRHRIGAERMLWIAGAADRSDRARPWVCCSASALTAAANSALWERGTIPTMVLHFLRGMAKRDPEGYVVSARICHELDEFHEQGHKVVKLV